MSALRACARAVLEYGTERSHQSNKLDFGSQTCSDMLRIAQCECTLSVQINLEMCEAAL